MKTFYKAYLAKSKEVWEKFKELQFYSYNAFENSLSIIFKGEKE